MATETGTEQGKTSFVEEFLKDHKDADLAAVNAAWKSFGREGTISDSLFGKSRRSLGLTRRRDGKKANPAAGTPAAATSAAVRKVGKRTATPRQISVSAEETPTRQSRKSDVAATSRVDDRNQMLIALEKDLDRLLFGILEMESMTEVEEHIRAARRVVSREIR
jgi:hypothetical protein